jgi:acetate---CoA ligase (ADP-forming)
MNKNDEARGLTPSDPPAVARLLKPRAVALVGASDDPRSIGGNVLANLERAGFAGSLHLVSRTRAEIAGHPCVATIDDLPPGLDAIVLNLPGEAVLEAVAACGRRGVNAAVVFASGFAEAGADGWTLQERLAAIAREAGVLLNGPNCLGLVNYVDAIPLTFGEYQPMPEAGAAAGARGVAVIAQSGAIANAIRDSLVASGLRVTFLVSTGNEAGLGAEDFLGPILEDEATGVVALFLEQVRQPRKLLRLAARAREWGKRLVLMQPGRTPAARGAAESHTGAVAGDLAVARVVLSHAGVAVVDGLDALTDVALLLAARPLPGPRRTAVMTNSGAMRGLTFDFAQDAGLDLAEWSPATAAALRALFPPFVTIDNPLDLGTAAFGRPELMRRAAQLLLDDPGVSSLILSLFPGRPPQQVEKAEQLLPVVRASPKPTAFVMLGDPMPLDAGFTTLARAHGAAVFRSTERAARAMAAVGAVARALAAFTDEMPADGVGHGQPFDLTHLPAGPVAEHRAKALLAAAGVPVPSGGLAQDLADAEAIAARIGFPVALKAQAAALSHKSDAGGVILNVGNAAALRQAWEKLHTDVHRVRPGLALDGVLVEAMARRSRGSIELIVGARRDPHWGAVLMLGLGGIWVEILQDVALLPAGAGKPAIVEALGRLKAAALLHGTRGAPPIDIAAVADIAHTLGGLLQRSPDLAELEINPLLAHPAGQGALALDALIVKSVPAETE